jgi:hypothetical protein
MITNAIKSARNHWRNACASVQRAMTMSNLRTEIKFLLEDIADIEERAANRVSQAVYYEGEVLPDLHTRLIRAQDQLARLQHGRAQPAPWPAHANRRFDYHTRMAVHIARGQLARKTATAAEAMQRLYSLGLSHADTMRILTKPPAGRRSRPGTNTSSINPHGRSGLASVRQHSGEARR